MTHHTTGGTFLPSHLPPRVNHGLFKRREASYCGCYAWKFAAAMPETELKQLPDIGRILSRSRRRGALSRRPYPARGGGGGAHQGVCSFFKGDQWALPDLDESSLATMTHHTAEDRITIVEAQYQQQATMASCDQTIQGSEVPLIVQELVGACVQEPPGQYVVPEQDRPAAAVSEMPEAIPIIDLSWLSAGSAEEFTKLRSALENWDIFLAVGHGMEPSFLAEATKATREFFNLPLEEKHEYSNIVGGEKLGMNGNDMVVKENQLNSWWFWMCVDYGSSFSDVVRNLTHVLESLTSKSLSSPSNSNTRTTLRNR